MPRTSYGDKKRSQAWKLVAALMERQGKQGVQFYQNGAGEAYLKVEASLLDMGRWSSLSIDDVREALTQHLNKNFLGIVADQREQKAGRGAEQWKFELRLWSTDQAENQQQFDKAWNAAKSGNTLQSEQADLLLGASGDHLSTSSPSNEARFKQVREHCRQKILSLHSRMRLLSGEEVGVDQLYVDVWLLNRSPRTFQVSQDKLLETFDLRNDRLGLGDRIQRNPGFGVANAKAKLLILGKPGAGKTTFLKHLAIDWCKGEFQPDLVAVFIELRRIQDRQWNLLDAIREELGLEASKQVEALLQQGKLLVLMDGLDEVPTNELRGNVQSQLRQIAKQYASNRWILTCRTQIIESIPVGFTSVEVADFSPEQVRQFVQNWFKASEQSGAEALQQWERFNHAVDKNPALKELTVTPVLLSLMCLVFQDEGGIPAQVTRLYQKGIKLLLSRWNEEKQIHGWEVGSEIYRELSVAQKEALLIEIAARKFENPKNFVLFEQEVIVAHIDEFLRRTNFRKRIARFLHLNNSRESIMVLKAMEAQHGLLIERADELWSFSHLTFQEYFTVQWLAQLPPGQLAEKIANRQWQQVVEQLVKSQQPADRLLHLIKQSIDQSISGEPTLNRFLALASQKAGSIQIDYKPSALRVFYCVLALDLARDPNLLRHLNLVHDLNRALNRPRALSRALNRPRVRNSELAVKLEQLKTELPSLQNEYSFPQRWGAHGQQWLKQLRQVMLMEHRNLGHDWQFNDQQKQQIQRYYAANHFLVNLMKIEGAVSEDVRAEIEDSLLLPWDELQRRQPDVYR